MTEGRVVLEADRLCKAFKGRTVLDDASLSVEAGRVTAVMGRNGAGKSTLLEAVVGRVAADRGRVFFDGGWLDRPVLSEMAPRGLFYSAQRGALTDLLRVGEQLGAVARTYGTDPAPRDVLALLALEALLDCKPADLSGGERKRCELGLAAVRRPSCLLIDEPFAGTAPKDRAAVTQALRALRHDGCALVLTGHDVEDVFAVADEIVWIAGGRTHALGSPERAREDARFRREYLGEAS